MDSTRRESLNPDFIHRLSRIQTAQMCRFCLNNSSDVSLINILDSEHVQMLIAECYHGCLGTLNGNASRFVCTSCYRRLEQSYEFLLHASRVQALVDTYTFHDGTWPQDSLVVRSSEVRKGEKRVASPDEEDLQISHIVSKKVRFEEIEDDGDQQLYETASKIRERCPTPGPFESSTEVIPEVSESSLETTLSGEIPGSELIQFSESSSVGSEPSPASDANYRRMRMKSTRAGSKVGEIGSDVSLVQSLCMQIEAIGVGKGDTRKGNSVIMLSKETSVDYKTEKQ